MALNLIDDAGIFKQGKLGLVDDSGIFEPLAGKAKGPSLIKEGAKAIPYLGVKAFQGLTQPFILEPLEALGIDTKKLVEDAAKYWKPDLGTIPDVGVGFEKGKPKLEKRRSDIAEILGATAGGAGFVAGPVRAAMTAGKAVTNLPALEKAARPFYRNILSGMIGGALTGEGKVDETLQNAALFGVFEGFAGLPKAIRDSNTWRKATIKERGIILQSLDDTMAKNPDMTEAELLRRYNNPKWYKEALSKRMRGEPTTEQPKGPIPGQRGGPLPQEIPPVPPGPPLAPTALKPKPQVIPLRPVSPEPGMPLFEEAGGPMIGKDFIEGTGEIQRPYPGQQRLREPLKRILPPRIPGIGAPPTDIGPEGLEQFAPARDVKRPTPGGKAIELDQLTKSAFAEMGEMAPVVEGPAVKGETFRAWLQKQGGINQNDKMWGGELKDISKSERSGPLKWQVGVISQKGNLMERVIEMAQQDPGWKNIITDGNDVLQALVDNPVRSDMIEDEVDNLWREEIRRVQDEHPDGITEKEIEADLQKDVKEDVIQEAAREVAGEKLTEEQLDEAARIFGDLPPLDTFKLTPEKGTPWERQAELEKEGVVERPERISKKAVFPTEGIKTIPGKQKGLFGPEKGESLDLFEQPIPKPVKAKPGIKPLSFEAWKSTRSVGEVNLEKKYKEYLKKPKTALAVSDTIEALYRETTTVPSAKKKKIIEVIKDQLKSEEGNIRLDTIIENIDTIKKIAKDANVNITDKDIKFLEEQVRLPYWRAKSDPAFARVYKVQDRRDTNRNVLRHGFLEDSLTALTSKGKDSKQLGELFHRGDIQQGELGEKGLAKLNPTVRKGYLEVRDTLNYIWFEHFPQELRNLGYSKGEIDDYRRQLGRIKGYFPHMRKGRYHIKVKETPESKETLYREHFDDIITTLTRGKVSYKAPIKLSRIRKEYPDATIIGPERNVEVPEELFFAIDPVALEQIIKYASKKVDVPDPKAFNRALQQAMAEVIQSRGFSAHGIKRRGVPGYDKKHWKQAYVEYISGYAGMITKMHAAKDFEGALRKINRIKTPGKFRFAAKYIHDVMRNQEQFDTTVDKFRGLMFYKYLGAVVKSATLNLTQNYIAGVPRLSVETKWGSAKITAEMEQAGWDVIKSFYDKNAKGKRVGQEVEAGLNAARKKGIITDQWTEELMGYAVGGYDTVTRKIANIMKFLFSKSEIFNREVMYIVAFRIARNEKKLGVSKSWEFAENIVKDVHFVYGKGNLPAVTRGGKPATAARGAYTFRTYPHQLMSLHRWLLREYGKDIKGKRTIPYSRVKGSYASIKGLLALMAFAGLSGIPFYKDLIAYYQKITGEDIEQAILEKAGRAKNVINYGLPGLIGIDFSGSISMELPSKISDLGGVVSQVPKDIIKTKEDIGRKNYYRSIEDFPATPSVMKYIMAAQRMKKGITSRRGLKVLDEKGQPIKLNAWETFLKTIGFQPVKASEIYRKRSAEYRRSSYWNKIRDNLIDVAISEHYKSKGKPGEFPSPDLQKAITEFNSKKPHDIVPVMPQTLIKRIGQKKTKRQRYRKQVIK